MASSAPVEHVIAYQEANEYVILRFRGDFDEMTARMVVNKLSLERQRSLQIPVKLLIRVVALLLILAYRHSSTSPERNEV